MLQIGRKIYYDKLSGNVIQDTGERGGGVVETTLDQDFQSYVSLQERVKDTVVVMQLNYGDYAQDFATCSGYNVDIVTNKLVFVYPDPNNPDAPAITQPSYEDRLSAVEEVILNLI